MNRVVPFPTPALYCTCEGYWFLFSSKRIFPSAPGTEVVIKASKDKTRGRLRIIYSRHVFTVIGCLSFTGQMYCPPGGKANHIGSFLTRTGQLAASEKGHESLNPDLLKGLILLPFSPNSLVFSLLNLQSSGAFCFARLNHPATFGA